MVVAVVLCHRTGILFFSCLDNFQSDHYSRMPTGSILDLTALFQFPVDCPPDMTSEQYRWRLVDNFVKNLNGHRAQIFFHPMKFASTSPCPGGMGKAAIGSTMACQCMLQSTGNWKRAVRSRMLPVGILE